MNSFPLVSIALSTYNGAKYLAQQLDSLIQQSYTNIEIIITDDCSQDNTVEIIQNYMQRDNRIKLYENIHNLGFVQNFEKAISLCSGEYIALADQDDIWKVNKIELFVKGIEDNILIYSDAILIDKDGEELGKNLICPKKNMVRGSCNKAFLITNCISGNTMMFRKDLIKNILPIPKGTKFHDVWIAFIAASCGTIIYTNEAMIYYRRHEDQVTVGTKSNYKTIKERFNRKKELKLQDNIKQLHILEAYLTKSSFLDKEVLKIINRMLKYYQNYQEIYFDFKLYFTLKRYSNELFAIRKKNMFKNCIGYKLDRLFLFSL